jgi:hypothetical protein
MGRALKMPEQDLVYYDKMIIIKVSMEFTAISCTVPAAVMDVVVKRKIPNVPVRFAARHYTY